MGKYLSVIIILCCSLTIWGQEKGAPFGVNLAGAEFGKIGTNEYGYPSPEELDYFKSHGLALFRLPFKWERIQPQLNGKLDAKELRNMKSFVIEAAKRNLLVVLDMHNYCRRQVGDTEQIINNGVVTAAHVSDAWKKIATEFKGFTNIWGYGLMNEPYNMPSKTAWFDIAQVMINSIRTVDLKTSIIVGGNYWSSAERWQNESDQLKNLKDPKKKLVFEAHVYFDEDASGSYKRTYEAEKAYESVGVERVKPFVSWLKKNNLKGFMGEYGIPNDDERWFPILEKTLAFLKENGVNGTYWAAGRRWGNYKLSVEPKADMDKPQLPSLKKYLYADNAPASIK